jgi:hypothetical protein
MASSSAMKNAKRAQDDLEIAEAARNCRQERKIVKHPNASG